MKCKYCFFERLKVCWFVLTTRHCAYYAYNKIVGMKAKGVRCYIDDDGPESYAFLSTIVDYTQSLIDKLENKDSNNINSEKS